MNEAVKKNLKRVAAAFLLFLIFLFFIVEAQIHRLTGEAAEICQTATAACMRSHIAVARWQTPFNSTPMESADKAYQMIVRSNFAAEKKYLLLNELRTSLFGTRSILRPENSTKKSIVLAKIDEALGFNSKMHVTTLGGEEPVYILQVLAQVCFFSWLIFVFIAIWRGMSATGDIAWPSFKRYLLYALLSFLSWLLCLSFA